jgi:hypothetical protein
MNNMTKRSISWCPRTLAQLSLLLLFASSLLTQTHAANANANAPPPQKQQQPYDFDALLRNVHACDNAVVRDMPGGAQAVLAAARLYIEAMRNASQQPLEKFQNRWKYEFDRVLPPSVDPPCRSLEVFGNERVNYDEAKRFCHVHRAAGAASAFSASSTSASAAGAATAASAAAFSSSALDSPTNSNSSSYSNSSSSSSSSGGGAQPCVVYSIGSNNKWDFEQNVFAATGNRRFCSASLFLVLRCEHQKWFLLFFVHFLPCMAYCIPLCFVLSQHTQAAW